MHVLVFTASANACSPAASSILSLWTSLLLTSPSRVGITPMRVWFPTHMRWCSHCPAFIILWNFSLLTSPSRVGITPMRVWSPTHMHWRSHRPALLVLPPEACVGLYGVCQCLCTSGIFDLITVDFVVVDFSISSRDHTNASVVSHTHALVLPLPPC